MPMNCILIHCKHANVDGYHSYSSNISVLISRQKFYLYFQWFNTSCFSSLEDTIDVTRHIESTPVTHICVSKLNINGADNDLSPGQPQANI